MPLDAKAGHIDLESVGYITPLKKALIGEPGWVKFFQNESVTNQEATSASLQLQKYLNAVIDEGRSSEVTKESDLDHLVDAKDIIAENLGKDINLKSLRAALKIAADAELKSFRDAPGPTLANSYAGLIDIGVLKDNSALTSNKASAIDQAREGFSAAGVTVPMGYIHPNKSVQSLIQHYGDGFGRIGSLAATDQLASLTYFKVNPKKNAAVMEMSGAFGFGGRITDDMRHNSLRHRGSLNGSQIELMTSIALEKGWTHISLNNVANTYRGKRKMEKLYAELTHAGLTVVGYEPSDRALRLLEEKQPMTVTPSEKGVNQTNQPAPSPGI